MNEKRGKIPGHWFESLFAIFIFCGIGYCTAHAVMRGYLPSPFFYEPSDTFADWYNPAYWARQGRAAYDIWGAFYPPLSFVFLQLTGFDSCYPRIQAFDYRAGILPRSCDWLGLVFIALIFLVNLVLTWKTFKKIDRSTAVNRTICVAFGAAMLQAVERGNLIMVAYTCLLLAFGPLLKSSHARAIAAGFAINFKLYLVGAVLVLLTKRRWLWVEMAGLYFIAIYVITYAIYGAGSPMQIYQNLTSYTDGQARSILDTWFASTYTAFLSAIEGGTFPLAMIIGSRWADFLTMFLPALKMFSQLLVLSAVAAIAFRPQGIAPHRAITLALLFFFITTESGIYILLFLSFFILQERWMGFGRIWAIAVCYVLAVPVDFALEQLPETVRETYFRNSLVIFGTDIPLGPLVRPMLLMSLGWSMSLVTLNDVWKGWLSARYRPIPMSDGE